MSRGNRQCDYLDWRDLKKRRSDWHSSKSIFRFISVIFSNKVDKVHKEDIVDGLIDL